MPFTLLYFFDYTCSTLVTDYIIIICHHFRIGKLLSSHKFGGSNQERSQCAKSGSIGRYTAHPPRGSALIIIIHRVPNWQLIAHPNSRTMSPFSQPCHKIIVFALWLSYSPSHLIHLHGRSQFVLLNCDKRWGRWLSAVGGGGWEDWGGWQWFGWRDLSMKY